MALLDPVAPGDPIRAPAWNEIVRILSDMGYVPRSVFSGGSSFQAHGPRPFPVTMGAITSVATTMGSIVIPSAGIAAVGFSNPTFTVDQYEDASAFSKALLTTRSTAGVNGKIKVEPIIPGIPYLLKYTGTAPAFEDEMAPKDSSTALEKDENGDFITIAPPITHLSLVWAMLKAPTSQTSAVYVGQLDGDVTTGNSGTFSIYSDQTTDTGDNLDDVENHTGETMKSGILLKAFMPVGWSVYVVEPFEVEPCP